MPFKLEQNGWVLGRLPDGGQAWVLKADCILQDEDGRSDFIRRRLLPEDDVGPRSPAISVAAESPRR